MSTAAHQAAWRAIAGTAGQGNEDMIAAAQIVTGVTGGTANENAIRLLKALTGSSATDINALRAAYADLVGASGWGAVDALPTFALDFTQGRTALPSVVTLIRSTTATYFDATGVMQTAAANAARFDYDPVTRSPKGILLEEARPNLLANPAAPTTQSVTVTAQSYTLSFYGTGSVVLSGAATGTVSGSGAFPARRTYTFTPTAGTLTLTISGTVQFANMEAGAYATSYIPGASRGSDNSVNVAAASVPGLSTAQGAVVVEWQFPGILPAGQVATIGLDDGSSANRLFLRVGQAGVADYTYAAGGTTYIDTAGVAVTAGTIIRQAFAWASGSHAHAVNGTLETNTSVTTMPASFTRLVLGAGTGSFWLRRVAVFPTRLSNAQLQRITA